MGLGWVVTAVILCAVLSIRAWTNFIVKAFITALTIGGPNGMPRPIELHAHDPLRYVFACI